MRPAVDQVPGGDAVSLPPGIAIAPLLAAEITGARRLLNGVVSPAADPAAGGTGYLLLLTVGRRGRPARFWPEHFGIRSFVSLTGAALACGSWASPDGAASGCRSRRRPQDGRQRRVRSRQSILGLRHITLPLILPG